MVPASPKHASTHTSQVVNAKYTLVYLTILSTREKQILSKKKNGTNIHKRAPLF